MARIALIGAGSWGTSLSILLKGNGHAVTVWTRSSEEARALDSERENKDKLPGVRIPDGVRFTADLEDAVHRAEQVVFVIPSQTIRRIAGGISKKIAPGTLLVCCSKGLEEETGLRLSEVIASEIPDHPVVGLYGPSHAEEVAIGIPTTVVSASLDRDAAETVQDAFMAPAFRVYTSSDLPGAEIGSALKNVIAICAGISDGLGFGDNSRAALMTRGITEIARLGIAMGGNARTFSGLTGIGDLIVTCTSKLSRNWNAGYLIGKGATCREAMEKVHMVVEGVSATRAAKTLAERMGVDMPIAGEAYRILFEGKNAMEAVRNLMTRSRKHETEEPGW